MSFFTFNVNKIYIIYNSVITLAMSRGCFKYTLNVINYGRTKTKIQIGREKKHYLSCQLPGATTTRTTRQLSACPRYYVDIAEPTNNLGRITYYITIKNINVCFTVSVLLCAGAAGVENDRTSVGSGNGAELSTNSACSRPEDELEKLPHRSSSSLGVVSATPKSLSCYLQRSPKRP